MQLSSVSMALLAIGLLAGAPAIAQPASPANATHKQQTDAENPSSVGPGSGAYKQHSDPQGWDADARAWHKQHTDGRESIGYADRQQRDAEQRAAQAGSSTVKQ